MRKKFLIPVLVIATGGFLNAQQQSAFTVADTKFNDALNKAIQSLDRADLRAASQALEEFSQHSPKTGPNYLDKDLHLSAAGTLASYKGIKNLTLSRLAASLSRLIDLWKNTPYSDVKERAASLLRDAFENVKKSVGGPGGTDVPTIRKLREDLGDITGQYYNQFDAATKKALTDASQAAENADIAISSRPAPITGTPVPPLGSAPTELPPPYEPLYPTLEPSATTPTAPFVAPPPYIYAPPTPSAPPAYEEPARVPSRVPPAVPARPSRPMLPVKPPKPAVSPGTYVGVTELFVEPKAAATMADLNARLMQLQQQVQMLRASMPS